MRRALIIAERELRAYFATPIAYVFLIIFLLITGVFTFYVGGYLERGIADLAPFFTYLPWLFLVLTPAITMRSWAEERRAGSIELLMTLPLSTGEAVFGKWLAGFIFMGLALAGTMPLWLTVNYLGAPDNGVIAGGYLGAWGLAGVFLAVGGCLSAATKNQVIAFVLALATCFVLLTMGTPIILETLTGWAPSSLVDVVAQLSALSHFDALSQGVIAADNVVYILSMIIFWLFCAATVLEIKKAD